MVRVAHDLDSVGNAEYERLLDVARQEFVRHGFRRTRIGDIALAAGVSRRTVNRRCGENDDLVAAVVRREVEAFIADASAAITSLGSPAERAVEAFVIGMRASRTNPLLVAIRRFEPDVLMDVLVRRPATMTWVAIGISAMIADETLPLEAAEPVAEVMLRVTLSLVVAPTEALPVETDDDARTFAHRYLVPAVLAAQAEYAGKPRTG